MFLKGALFDFFCVENNLLCMRNGFLNVFYLKKYKEKIKQLETWEVLLETILGLVGVWEAKRLQGRGLEGFGVGPGVAGDPDLGPTCA